MLDKEKQNSMRPISGTGTVHKLFFELVPQQGGERKQDKTKGDLKFLRTVSLRAMDVERLQFKHPLLYLLCNHGQVI